MDTEETCEKTPDRVSRPLAEVEATDESAAEDGEARASSMRQVSTETHAEPQEGGEAQENNPLDLLQPRGHTVHWISASTGELQTRVLPTSKQLQYGFPFLPKSETVDATLESQRNGDPAVPSMRDEMLLFLAEGNKTHIDGSGK
jgi:hypothetical protein